MHPHETALKAMAETLQMAYDQAETLPGELSAIKITVQNNTRTIINRINGMMGAAMTTHGQPEAGPLETILGQPIQRPLPVQPAQLKPTDAEKEAFKVKRDELYDSFPAENKEVFALVRKEGGESLIRAVAKKAGVPEYQTQKVDDKFINKMREAIKAKA